MKIEVTIDKLGRATSIEVNNVKGASCTDITKSLETALMSSSGMSTTNTKPEYYQMTDGTQTEVETEIIGI